MIVNIEPYSIWTIKRSSSLLSLLNKLIGFLLGNLCYVYEFNRAVYVGWFVFDRTLKKVSQVIILQVHSQEVSKDLNCSMIRLDQFLISIKTDMSRQQLFHFASPITSKLLHANFDTLAVRWDEILIGLTHHLLQAMLDDVVTCVIGLFGRSFLSIDQCWSCISWVFRLLC